MKNLITLLLVTISFTAGNAFAYDGAIQVEISEPSVMLAMADISPEKWQSRSTGGMHPSKDHKRIKQATNNMQSKLDLDQVQLDEQNELMMAFKVEQQSNLQVFLNNAGTTAY